MTSQLLRSLLPAFASLSALAQPDSVTPPPQERTVVESASTPQVTDSTLGAVTISGRHYDNAIGMSDAASQGVIRSELLESRPALRPGEVLEFVPGLIVTQHSGDGKANQYFLRGFNLDHGTDFATSVDGMPVNMPTHGHGQGYSDMNFLMPELVDRIEYRKGPYFATQGDFASAGAADIRYKRRLDAPFVQFTAGGNGYRRGLAGASKELSDDLTVLGAVEWMGNDGPWSVPENLSRKNAVLRLSKGTQAQGGSLSLMAYEGHWTSTDQVPQRLIDAGSYQGKPFGRFDSLDPTDGGKTSRYSLSGEWHQRDNAGETKVSAYAMHYALQLFSNFTYALDRPDTGDQFSQKDNRNVFGAAISRAWNHSIAGLDTRSEVGLQLRHDNIHVGFYDTQARQILETVRADKVRQTQLGLYAQSEVQLTPWLRTVVGLRGDTFRFDVNSQGQPLNSGKASAHQISPKFALIAGPWKDTEFFLNAGKGFHSNDARGVTGRLDPRTGDAVDPAPGIVPSRGWEIGARTEALADLQTSVSYWHLKSNSELIYVGDAGTTEASLASRRHGVEINNRWTPGKHFLLDADFAFSKARFTNGDRIPNAVDFVSSVAATLRDLGPWTTSLQWRYLGSSALLEDNSVRSKPVSTVNWRLTRSLKDVLGREASLTLDVFNLFNKKFDDIQYFYASRLPSEATSIDDRIVHPGEPRALRITFRTRF
ncbi:MAG: TonB-dependent receptor [Comamonas sp.]